MAIAGDIPYMFRVKWYSHKKGFSRVCGSAKLATTYEYGVVPAVEFILAWIYMKRMLLVLPCFIQHAQRERT
jgi:hypothetical protein